MEISHSGIGEKVCVTKSHSSTDKYGVYGLKTGNTSSKETSLCGGTGGSGSSGSNSSQVLKDFIRGTLGNGSTNWPTSTGTEDTTRAPKPNDNAKAVATDLVALNRDEKTIVAGLLEL
ncbi:hypothetical protein ANAPRD1_01203 [Anaplasma phagocytophilum]|uniref:hypothetical protein n=1 Tax=Anaplasma phagocytophilum TaxID=948 RepID=UPI0007E1DD7C|nr:hypothetical protein [Anaplasma phagocytophilum]SCV66681.1 hypothetical protein ANAPRD1_01203 [Anaplasma phagocytophilum]